MGGHSVRSSGQPAQPLGAIRAEQRQLTYTNFESMDLSQYLFNMSEIETPSSTHNVPAGQRTSAFLNTCAIPHGHVKHDTAARLSRGSTF